MERKKRINTRGMAFAVSSSGVGQKMRNLRCISQLQRAKTRCEMRTARRSRQSREADQIIRSAKKKQQLRDAADDDAAMMMGIDRFAGVAIHHATHLINQPTSLSAPLRGLSRHFFSSPSVCPRSLKRKRGIDSALFPGEFLFARAQLGTRSLRSNAPTHGASLLFSSLLNRLRRALKARQCFSAESGVFLSTRAFE